MAKGFTSTLTSPKKTIGVSNPTDLLNVSFLNYFETLTDPRIERSKEHLLIDIVAIAILAVQTRCRWMGSNRTLWNNQI